MREAARDFSESPNQKHCKENGANDDDRLAFPDGWFVVCGIGIGSAVFFRRIAALILWFVHSRANRIGNLTAFGFNVAAEQRFTKSLPATKLITNRLLRPRCPIEIIHW